MSSTYSPSLRIELIGAGEQSGTWNTTTNSNLGTLIEQAISGVTSITMTDANYTLTAYNGVSDQSRQAVIVVSGTNAAIRDIVAPLVNKTYLIKNNTSGGFDIRVRAATGASVSIPNGVTSIVYCDGTNFNLGIAQTSVAAGTGISVGVVGATNTISFGPITSAQLATALSDATGSGSAVFATSPTLVTPNLGTPTSGNLSNCTGSASALNVGFATSAASAATASNLNGTWTQMPAGTTTNFFQAAAPTGWTQNNTYTNHMMRIVSGTGGGSGGTNSPILNNVVPSHTHGFTTVGVSANHTHYDSGHTHNYDHGMQNISNYFSGGSYQGFAIGPIGTYTTTTGYASIGYMSADHSHSGSTDNGSSQTNWTPQYIDNILCSKN